MAVKIKRKRLWNLQLLLLMTQSPNGTSGNALRCEVRLAKVARLRNFCRT